MARDRKMVAALSLLKRRASGGGVDFPELIARNPKGWGVGPPPREFDFPTTGEFTPSGEPIPDLSKMPMFGSKGPAAGLEKVAEQNWPEALALVPMAKPLEIAARYGKTAAPFAAGALGFGANMASAGPEGESPEGEIARLSKEKADLQSTRDKLTQDFMEASRNVGAELSGKGKTGRPGKGPTSDALAAQAKGIQDQAAKYDAQIGTIDDRIKQLQYQMTPAYKQEQDLIKSNIEARKPWYERTGIPYFEEAATWGPPIAAAALMRGKMNKITEEGAAIVQRINEAVKGGDYGAEAAARLALDAWKRAAPKESIAALAKTVLLPGAVRTTGMAGDATFGPDVKDKEGRVLPGGAKAQAQEHLGRMFGHEGPGGALEEWGPPILQGLEAASAGAMLAKRPPMGTVDSETSYLRGITNPESGPLAKALGYAGPRSMSPDQIAVELAKRRASIPGSAATGPTGPEPVWPQLMREKPTSLAAEAPGTSDLSIPNSSAPRLGPGASGPPRLPAPQSVGSPATEGALSNPPASASELPPGIGRDKNGVLYDLHTGRKIHKRYFTSKEDAAPKPKPFKRDKQPKSATSIEEPLIDDNGIPVKPPKPFDPDDPINRGSANGGRIQHALGLARKYANGGTVGPLVGNTGGRADKLATSVPSGAYVIPADVISHWGEGNTLRGMDIMRHMFGGASNSRASGGEVPVYLSDGEFVVSPEAVAAHGGHSALDKFVLDSRAEHIKTLKSLPPPAR